jgi:hypothetical protein
MAIADPFYLGWLKINKERQQSQLGQTQTGTDHQWRGILGRLRQEVWVVDRLLQPRQPLPGILDFGQAGVGFRFIFRKSLNSP